MHSYLYQGHEKVVERIAKDIGFMHISLSASVMPMAKIVPRGFTACADAYLTPKIKDYVQGRDAWRQYQCLFVSKPG